MMISAENTFEVRKTSLANILQRQLPQAKPFVLKIFKMD